VEDPAAQVPRSWIGSYVFLYPQGTHGERDKIGGTLDEVSSDGLVLLQSVSVSWEEGDPSSPPQTAEDYASRHKTEYRLRPKFYTWRSIYAIRQQEEEEQRNYQDNLLNSLGQDQR
jgi:hypothetical protein